MTQAKPTSLPPDDAEVPVRHPQAPPPGSVLPSHYRSCFGCGVDHPTGLHLQVTAGEGCTVRAEMVVGPHHQGAPGLAHGGLLAAAFDEALGSAVWLRRVPAVTGHLGTDFRAPVPVGSTLVIEAECFAVAGRKMYARAVGRLGSGGGPVVVEADAVFIAVAMEHFRDNGRPDDVEAYLASTEGDAAARGFEVNP